MELRRYLRIFRRGWALLALCTVAGLAVAAVYLVATPKSVTATTSLLLSTGGTGSAEDLSRTTTFLSDTAAAYAQIVDSSVVLDPAAERLGDDPDDVGSEVTTNVNKSTTIIDIAVTGKDPVQVTHVANAVAASALATLPTLQRNSRGVPLYQVTQLRPADYPTAPSGPRPQRAVAVGIIVGFSVGVGAMMILHKFDDRIHRPMELEALSRLPVLAVVPRPTRRWRRNRPPEPDPAVADGYRRLRAALLHGETGAHEEVLLCTPRDDRSTFALHVAESFTQIGLRVILIDTDLACSETARRNLCAAGTPGLAEVLSGRAWPLAVLQDTTPRLRVMGSGTPTPEHAGLADRQALTGTIETLTSECDQVVIQAPPAFRGDEMALLARATGRYVLFVRAGRTRTPELASALAVLEDSPGRTVGVVLTGARSRDVPGRRDLVQASWTKAGHNSEMT